MRKMEKCMLAATLICGSTTVLTSCSDSNDNPVVKEKPTDYSQESNWYKIPAITKEFDTFYIYSTIYFGAGGARHQVERIRGVYELVHPALSPGQHEACG